MAVFAVGLDIVEVARFAEDRLSARFFEAVFTAAEIRYCRACASPAQHFAARFAAKEAAAKALFAVCGFVSVCQVEVVRAPSGAPSIVLRSGRHGEPAPALPAGAKILVSLSHSDHYAVATAIVSD